MSDPVVFQKLQAWQDREGVSDEELARLVSKGLGRDIHRTTISRAKRGLRVLGMDIQLELQRHTKVPPAEWADFYAQTVALRPSTRGSTPKKSPASATTASQAA